MKPKYFFLLFFILALVLTGCTNKQNQLNNMDGTSSTDNNSNEFSKEELYQDIFLTILNPYIDEAIKQHYGDTIITDPLYQEIISAERLQGYRSLDFELKIKVKPYKGAHIVVGEDIITIKVNTGKVEVLNSEHIKDYPLPSHLLLHWNKSILMVSPIAFSHQVNPAWRI